MPRLLTTKMIRHSRSMQKQTCRNAISNKGFDAEYSYDIVWCDLLLASCRTLGRCLSNPWVPRNPWVLRNPGWKSLLYAL